MNDNDIVWLRPALDPTGDRLKYHLSLECALFYSVPRATIRERTVRDAIAEGRRPCRKCEERFPRG